MGLKLFRIDLLSSSMSEVENEYLADFTFSHLHSNDGDCGVVSHV